VHTDDLPTDAACPTLVLISDELPYALFFNIQKILHHAHAIFGPISLIQVFQSLTGEGRTAMITVFTLAFRAETQGALSAAFRIRSQTTITWIFFPDIGDAKPAVHSTGSNIRYLCSGAHPRAIYERKPAYAVIQLSSSF